MRLSLLLGLFTLLFPAQSWAVAAFDAVAQSKCTDVGCASDTTLTYSHTVGSGSNRQLAVFAFISCGGSETPPAISTVTYAGTSLTSITSVLVAGRKGYLYAWPTGSQPTSGANNVVVTVAASLVSSCATRSGTINTGSISATGVDQTTTFTSTNTNSGSGTSGTITLSASGANDLGVHAACSGTSMTSTTETVRWDSDDAANSCASLGGATAAGGDTSFSWTFPSDSWAMIGAAFKEATAGATDETFGFLRRRF